MKNQNLTPQIPSNINEPEEYVDSANAKAKEQEIDLKAYFKRIRYTGEPTPTLQTLKDLHLLHPQAISFENLNSFLRLPVKLDRNSIYQKLLFSNRGGYCFEQNLLLMNVLQALGYKVKGLAARVLWNVPEGVTPARGHMLLLVEAEGKKFVADVGFGGLTLTAPLQLKTNIEQQTPHEVFRLKGLEEEYILESKIKEDWKALYSFSLQEFLLPDYEVTSWYLSNHPDSHFVTSLIAARVDNNKRYALRKNQFSTHILNKETERRIISSTLELRRLLSNIFQIDIPETSNTEALLQQLVENNSAEI